VEKFWKISSVLNKEDILNEEKMDDTGPWISPRKYVHLLAAQCEASKSSAHTTIKLSKLCPHKSKPVQLFPQDWEAGTWHCRWSQEMVNNGFLDSNLIFVLVGTWFMLSRNDIRHNNRYWCSENPHAVHDV
jgi:hypothetical protein